MTKKLGNQPAPRWRPKANSMEEEEVYGPSFSPDEDVSPVKKRFYRSGPSWRRVQEGLIGRPRRTKEMATAGTSRLISTPEHFGGSEEDSRREKLRPNSVLFRPRRLIFEEDQQLKTNSHGPAPSNDGTKEKVGQQQEKLNGRHHETSEKKETDSELKELTQTVQVGSILRDQNTTMYSFSEKIQGLELRTPPPGFQDYRETEKLISTDPTILKPPGKTVRLF